MTSYVACIDCGKRFQALPAARRCDTCAAATVVDLGKDAPDAIRTALEAPRPRIHRDLKIALAVIVAICAAYLLATHGSEEKRRSLLARLDSESRGTLITPDSEVGAALENCFAGVDAAEPRWVIIRRASSKSAMLTNTQLHTPKSYPKAALDCVSKVAGERIGATEGSVIFVARGVDPYSISALVGLLPAR